MFWKVGHQGLWSKLLSWTIVTCDYMCLTGPFDQIMESLKCLGNGIWLFLVSCLVFLCSLGLTSQNTNGACCCCSTDTLVALLLFTSLLWPITFYYQQYKRTLNGQVLGMPFLLHFSSFLVLKQSRFHVSCPNVVYEIVCLSLRFFVSQIARKLF